MDKERIVHKCAPAIRLSMLCEMYWREDHWWNRWIRLRLDPRKPDTNEYARDELTTVSVQ